ncbi:MAG: carbohydrate ABC transporter permease [Propionicimonas sp.]
MTVQVRAGHRAPLFAMLRGITKVPLYVILLAGAVVSAFPIYWMIVAGTRSTADIYSSPPVLLPGGFLGTNWRSLFEGTTFLGNLGVSLLLATAYTILAGLVSAMAGFALAKYQFRGRQALVTVMLMMMTIPYQVTLVPLFEMMSAFGWLDTFQGALLPTLLNAFGVFFMRQTFLQFPNELIEAAQIDGASDSRIFFGIALPAVRPAAAVLALVLFMAQWNSFLWPLLVLVSPEKFTAPVYLASLIGLTATDYGVLMLGTAVATLPSLLIFLLFQRQFVSGIVAGAVKA